jgi:flavodoxin
MNNILVCYFSASGTTKNVALKVSEVLNADLFEIEPVIKYTDEDLDWTDKNSRTSIEMQDKSSRPNIKNKVLNIDNYDTIIIGFPVWWYTCPTIINTFIEENDLKNKKIYIFVTSGGSSFGGSLKDLKNTYPDLNFINGKRFNINESEDEIKKLLV